MNDINPMGQRDNARSVWILSHRHDHMQEFNDLKVFTLINTSEIAKAVLQLQLVLSVSSFPSDPRTLTPALEAVYFYFYDYYAHLWPHKEMSRTIFIWAISEYEYVPTLIHLHLWPDHSKKDWCSAADNILHPTLIHLHLSLCHSLQDWCSAADHILHPTLIHLHLSPFHSYED